MNLVVLCVRRMPKSNATHFFLANIYSRILKIHVDGTLVYTFTFYKLSIQLYSFASAWNDIYA